MRTRKFSTTVWALLLICFGVANALGAEIFNYRFVEITCGRSLAIPARNIPDAIFSCGDSSVVAIRANSLLVAKKPGSVVVYALNPLTNALDSCRVTSVPWVVGNSRLIVDSVLTGIRAVAVSQDTVFFQGAGTVYPWRNLYSGIMRQNGMLGPLRFERRFPSEGGKPVDAEAVVPTPFGNYILAKRETPLSARRVFRTFPLLENPEYIGSVFGPVGDAPVSSIVMQQGMSADRHGNVYLGEYNNDDSLLRAYQPRIYKILRDREGIDPVYTFPPRNISGPDGGIRHVHATQVDPFSGDIWIGTGDGKYQSRILYHQNQLLPDSDGVTRLVTVGTGSQEYRTVSFAFTERYVYWFMDAPIDSQKIFRISRAEILRPRGADEPFAKELVASIPDKAFYNNCSVEYWGKTLTLLETVYEDAAQYGSKYRELDAWSRIYAMHEYPDGAVAVQQVLSGQAQKRFGYLRPIGQTSSGQIILTTAQIDGPEIWSVYLARLIWNPAWMLTVSPGRAQNIQFPGTSLSLSADVLGGGYLSAFTLTGRLPALRLPAGIAAILPSHWDLQGDEVVLENPAVTLTVPTLQSLPSGGTLRVLHAKPGDSVWTDVGGIRNGGTVTSTRPFSSLGWFAIGIARPTPMTPIQLRGDVDRNGSIGAQDEDLLFDHVLGRVSLDTMAQWGADMTLDGHITAADARSLYLYLNTGSSLAGTPLPEGRPEVVTQRINRDTVLSRFVLRGARNIVSFSATVIFNPQDVDVASWIPGSIFRRVEQNQAGGVLSFAGYSEHAIHGSGEDTVIELLSVRFALRSRIRIPLHSTMLLQLNETPSTTYPNLALIWSGDGGGQIPEKFSLAQNFPNPFNAFTVIRFGLPQREHVTLTVYNLIGERITILLDEERLPGYHEVNFTDPLLPSGVYLCTLHAGQFFAFTKILLIK